MQALRNLNRGMWITSWYASLLLVSVLVIDGRLDSGEPISILGLEYEQPIFFEYWVPVWMLVLVSLAGVLFFWILAESIEEDYIEYLFADYVVAVASEAEDISFDEDTPLNITGQLDFSSGHLVPPDVKNGIEAGEDAKDPEDNEESTETRIEQENGDSDSSHGSNSTSSE